MSDFYTVGLNRGEYRRGLQQGAQRAVTSLGDGLQRDPYRDHDQALYLLELGDLNRAESTFRRLGFQSFPEGNYRYSRDFDAIFAYAARQNLIDVLVLKGDLLAAEHIADTMSRAYEANDLVDRNGFRQRLTNFHYLEVAIAARGEASGSNPFARRAHVRALRGDVTNALSDFKAAELFQHDMSRRWYGGLKQYYDARAFYPHDMERIKQAVMQTQAPLENPPLPALTGQAALYYGVLLTRLGKLRSALKVIDYNRQWAQHYLFRPMAARAHVYQSDVHRLMGEYEQADHELELPLEWAAGSGHREIHTLALLAKARLHLAQQQLDDALTAAEQAHTLAERHGFTLLRIDTLITRGHIAYQSDSFDDAYSLAESALALAQPIECRYLWGHASALHLMGMVELTRRDQTPIARTSHETQAYHLLSGAAEIRERIRDPRLANTQALLADLPAPEEDN